MAGRVGVGIEGMQFVVFWYFSNDVLKAMLPLMVTAFLFLLLFGLKGPLLLFFFFL